MSKLKAETMKHYANLAECRDWGDFMLEGWGWRDCPLCQTYPDEDCKGCPVAIETGLSKCEGTPWRNMSVAIAALGGGYHWTKLLPGPLPEVLTMKEFLEALDWEGQP